MVGTLFAAPDEFPRIPMPVTSAAPVASSLRMVVRQPEGAAAAPTAEYVNSVPGSRYFSRGMVYSAAVEVNSSGSGVNSFMDICSDGSAGVDIYLLEGTFHTKLPEAHQQLSV